MYTFSIYDSSPDVDKDKIGPEIMQEIRTGVRMPLPFQPPPSQMPGLMPTGQEAGHMPAINIPGALGSRLPLPGAPMLPMNMAPPPHLQFSGAPHMPQQPPQMQPSFGAMGQVNPVPPLLSSPSPAPPPPSQHSMGMGMPSQHQQQMRPPGPPMTSASTAPPPPPPPAPQVTFSNAPMVPQPLLSMPTAPPAGLLPSALLPRPPVPLLSLNVPPPAPQVTPEVVAAVEAGVGPEVAASLFHQMQQRGPPQVPMSGIGVIPLPPPPPDEPSAKRARPDAEDAGLNLIPEEEFLARFPVGWNYNTIILLKYIRSTCTRIVCIQYCVRAAKLTLNNNTIAYSAIGTYQLDDQMPQSRGFWLRLECRTQRTNSHDPNEPNGNGRHTHTLSI